MSEMTNERLVVLLEARLNQFEKNFQKASGIGTRTYQGLQKGSRSATRQMEQDMARAARSVNQSLASITGNIGAFGKGLIGGAVAGLAAGGVAVITQNAGRIVKGIAEIGNEAKRAGVSAQAFQEWKFVAEQNRIGVDSLVDGFKELSLRADEFITTGVGPAAEAFTRLGYRASDLKTKLKDPSKLMLEILGRLEGFDKAAQIRIADEVFGGTGGERFVELLGKGQGALQDTMNKAHDAGAVMDDQLIAKADELDRKFNELTARVTNFGKSVVVAAADAVIELTDLRDKIDDLFPDQAKGRDVLGSEVYDAMAADADLADKNAENIRHLADEYQYLSQEATNTASRLGDFARELDAAGYSEQAATIRDYADSLAQVTQEYASGQIDAEQFSERIQEVQANAEDAFASLQDVDGVSFAGARAEMATLGGSIASVISLARSLAGALAAAAGVDTGSKRAAAADRKMAAEQASLDVLEAQTEANKKFTASEDARNTATAETLRLEKVRADVAKRAQDSGARFSDDQINEFARAQIAADEARAAAGKGGKGGGKSKGGGGGGGKEKLDDFAREAQQIKERTEALQIEAQVYAEVAASGVNYGDAMAYAEEKARLLAAAQQAGKEITPALEAEIDQLAMAYATAGMEAEEAAERMKKIDDAAKRGKDALESMFGGIIDGSTSAREAVANLLAEIAKAQLLKGIMNLPGMGAASGFIGNLLSYDGGGYTGNGTRTGGLDGKGGRLAVVHPRETITDHTKGQSVPGEGGQMSAHITIGIDPKNGNITAFVEERAGAVAARTVAANNRQLPNMVQKTISKPRTRW